MENAAALKNLVVFLVAAGIIVPLFHRARIGAVLGFLIVGLTVGPHGLGGLVADNPWLYWVTFDDAKLARLLAELGVIFLLFLLGLEMSMRRVWAMRRLVFGVGGLQFAISAAAIGACAALAGVGASGAIVLGLCLAMSSTAMVVQILEEEGRTVAQSGRVAIAVLLFQDLMVAPVLFGTQALGRTETSIAIGLGSALLQAAVAIAAIVGAGYYLMRPLLRLAARTGSRELLLAITLLLVIAAATLTGGAGLSTALGAFLAGLLISETEYRHQVEIDIAPVKGLLLGVFFVTVGMSIDVHAAWQQMERIAAAVVALLVIKTVVLYAVCRLMRLPRPVSGEVAVLLPQAGEFAFIVVAMAAIAQTLPSEVAQFAAAVAGLTMLLTPPLAALSRRIGALLAQREQAGTAHAPHAGAGDFEDHVVIGGCGRIGQTLARMLHAESVDFAALDNDSELVSALRRSDGGVFKSGVFVGDAGRPEMLERIGARRARAFIVTVNDPKAAERMIAAARQCNPEAPVFARAVDPTHAVHLLKLGAQDVMPEALEASLQMGARVLEALGLSDEAVLLRVERAREQELRRLTEQMEKA